MQFLIKCTCGNYFWRKTPCNNRLRPWDCPRHRQRDIHGHQTILTSLGEQLWYVNQQEGVKS